MAVVFSQNLIINAEAGSVFPLNYARIGYQSYLEDATITSSIVEDEGYPVSNIVNSQTFERYKVTAAQVAVDVDLGEAKYVDYCATTGRASTVVVVQYSLDGISYETAGSLSDEDKAAKMILFDSIFARYWKIIYADFGVIDVANAKLGLSLAMYRPIYGGHSPSTLSRQTVIRPTISEGGEFISSSITRQGFKTNYDFRHLSADWYREFFDPFVEHARTGTYYIAWNPEQFPKEVIYAWTSTDITPSNMGIRDLMQVSWGAGGYDVS